MATTSAPYVVVVVDNSNNNNNNNGARPAVAVANELASTLQTRAPMIYNNNHTNQIDHLDAFACGIAQQYQTNTINTRQLEGSGAAVIVVVAPPQHCNPQSIEALAARMPFLVFVFATAEVGEQGRVPFALLSLPIYSISVHPAAPHPQGQCASLVQYGPFRGNVLAMLRELHTNTDSSALRRYWDRRLTHALQCGPVGMLNQTLEQCASISKEAGTTTSNDVEKIGLCIAGVCFCSNYLKHRKHLATSDLCKRALGVAGQVVCHAAPLRRCWVELAMNGFKFSILPRADATELVVFFHDIVSSFLVGGAVHTQGRVLAALLFLQDALPSLAAVAGTQIVQVISRETNLLAQLGHHTRVHPEEALQVGLFVADPTTATTTKNVSWSRIVVDVCEAFSTLSTNIQAQLLLYAADVATSSSSSSTSSPTIIIPRATLDDLMARFLHCDLDPHVSFCLLKLLCSVQFTPTSAAQAREVAMCVARLVLEEDSLAAEYSDAVSGVASLCLRHVVQFDPNEFAQMGSEDKELWVVVWTHGLAIGSAEAADVLVHCVGSMLRTSPRAWQFVQHHRLHRPSSSLHSRIVSAACDVIDEQVSCHAPDLVAAAAVCLPPAAWVRQPIEGHVSTIIRILCFHQDLAPSATLVLKNIYRAVSPSCVPPRTIVGILKERNNLLDATVVHYLFELLGRHVVAAGADLSEIAALVTNSCGDDRYVPYGLQVLARLSLPTAVRLIALNPHWQLLQGNREASRFVLSRMSPSDWQSVPHSEVQPLVEICASGMATSAVSRQARGVLDAGGLISPWVVLLARAVSSFPSCSPRLDVFPLEAVASFLDRVASSQRTANNGVASSVLDSCVTIMVSYARSSPDLFIEWLQDASRRVISLVLLHSPPSDAAAYEHVRQQLLLCDIAKSNSTVPFRVLKSNNNNNGDASGNGSECSNSSSSGSSDEDEDGDNNVENGHDDEDRMSGYQNTFALLASCAY
eukprot:PhM_4_TR18454/c0_g1_i1/m.17644